ncbi:MAG: hypothetical protein AB7U46_03425 [Paenirhodobacter sp.]|uniref:hypothetical protein n=1 Tax=Paenirhodobacter sp. TaxID=1965326 RepID=UPI003D0E53AB
MRNGVVFALAGLMLAACEPTVPNSGVGFGNYEDYLRTREAELQGQKAPATTAPTTAPVMTEPLNGGAYGTSGYGATPVTSPAGIAAQQQADAGATAPAQGTIGADTLAALKATAPAGDTGAAETAPAASAPLAGGSVGAPLDAMAPGTPMNPAASARAAQGSAGPNLAAYALSVTNAPGQSVYNRGGLHLTSTKAACRKYVSPDLAQMAFLEKGGPTRDPLNLDPDGDGFACGWDPRPFQMARP